MWDVLLNKQPDSQCEGPRRVWSFEINGWTILLFF